MNTQNTIARALIGISVSMTWLVLIVAIGVGYYIGGWIVSLILPLVFILQGGYAEKLWRVKEGVDRA